MKIEAFAVAAFVMTVLAGAAHADATAHARQVAQAPGGGDAPQAIIADQVRRQGLPCVNPRNAERVPGASKPDEAVWLLKCENATYRVRLIPDLAARIERVE